VRNIEKQKDKRVQNHSCFESLINQNTFQDVKKNTHTHTSQGVEKNG
jgi:CRISPR/Cas system-associated endoribonuclease Cas2